MKKLATALTSVALLLTVGTSALASEASISPKGNLVVEESVNNGVKVYTVSGEGSKADASNLLNNYQAQKQLNSQRDISQSEISPMGTAWTCYSGQTVIAYGSSVDAKNTTTVNNFCSGVDLLTFPFETKYRSAEKGSQQAFWGGSTPFRADKIVLKQTTKFTGVAFSVAAPPGGSASSDTAVWESEPMLNEYVVNVDRPRVEAKTSAWTSGWIDETQVIDGSDIYIGSTIYRPQSVINF
ncbi:hypothetical protein ACFFNY_03640 [Paenibacillus hodogayensis]|uniref:Uncharacterized protein n=1 Tax=Paenibacillus hodogayensis TaxID=279208 RepID=A0ABV5VQW8_9BACL